VSPENDDPEPDMLDEFYEAAKKALTAKVDDALEAGKIVLRTTMDGFVDNLTQGLREGVEYMFSDRQRGRRTRFDVDDDPIDVQFEIKIEDGDDEDEDE